MLDFLGFLDFGIGLKSSNPVTSFGISELSMSKTKAPKLGEYTFFVLFLLTFLGFLTFFFPVSSNIGMDGSKIEGSSGGLEGSLGLEGVDGLDGFEGLLGLEGVEGG